MVAVGLLSHPKETVAQTLPAVVGGVGGLVAGSYVTTGLYVLKSRATGWMMHSPTDLVEPRLEGIPLIVGPVAGALIGYRDSDRLARAGLWGVAGMAAGATVGAATGHWVWGDSGGRWSGGVIGSAAGLLAGVVYGALVDEEPTSDPPVGDAGSELRFEIPAPWGRRQ